MDTERERWREGGRERCERESTRESVRQPNQVRDRERNII